MKKLVVRALFTYFISNFSLLGNDEICVNRLIDEMTIKLNQNNKIPPSKTSFEIGEYIGIGASKDPNKRYQTIKGGHKINIPMMESRYIGTYQGVYDDKHYIVRVSAIDSKLNMNLPPTDFIVPIADAVHLPKGTIKKTIESLKGFTNIALNFTQNETVRYRNLAGQIKLGVVKKINKENFELDDNGISVSIDKEMVFKYDKNTRGVPQTVIYKTSWDLMKQEKPKGVFLDLLNGAAKLTSHQSYLKKSIIEKLDTLRSYTDKHVFYDSAAMGDISEQAGLNTYDKLICAGVGVCRHQSVIHATILQETGFNTRLLKYTPPNERGHTWLEVIIPDDNGKDVVLVVDPTNYYIDTFANTIKRGESKMGDFEKRFYLNPAREVTLPSN